MSLNLSDGGLSSILARSIVIPLKFSSSSGRFRDSHAGVRRTGSVESFRPKKLKKKLLNHVLRFITSSLSSIKKKLKQNSYAR